MSDPALEAWKADVERRLAALEVASRPPQAPGGRAPGKVVAPREFLLTKNPPSMNDRVLTAGYYIETVVGEESFDMDRLYAFLGQAKEALPANRRDPPYQNVKRGFFMEIGDRGRGKTARNRWSLTNAGIKRVESGFKE